MTKSFGIFKANLQLSWRPLRARPNFPQVCAIERQPQFPLTFPVVLRRGHLAGNLKLSQRNNGQSLSKQLKAYFVLAYDRS